MVFFTIIIPVYNTEQYLDQCIRSILTQDFTGYEIILVDDGSTDNSAAICDKYELKYDAINVIHQENNGPFAARKSGVFKANGKYILFLDSDDYFNINALRIIYDKLNKSLFDILVFNFTRVDSDGTEIQVNDLLLEGKIYTREEILQNAISSNRLNNLCNKAVKTDLCKKAHINCDVNTRYGEDLFITLRLFNISEKIGYLNKCLYNYRFNGKSSTSIIDICIFSDFAILYLEELKYIQRNNHQRIEINQNIMLSILQSLFVFCEQSKPDNSSFCGLCDEIIHYQYFEDAIKNKLCFGIIWNIEFLLLKKRHIYLLRQYLYSLIFFKNMIHKFLYYMSNKKDNTIK